MCGMLYWHHLCLFKEILKRWKQKREGTEEEPRKSAWHKEKRNGMSSVESSIISMVGDNYILTAIHYLHTHNMHQFSSVIQLCPTLCNPMDHSTPGLPDHQLQVYPNSCPLSQWCHPTLSSSVTPFSSCPQSFPASESFLVSQLFASGGQSFGASAPPSVLPLNLQDWFPLGLTGWISLQSKALSRVFSGTTMETINDPGEGSNSWFYLPWMSHKQPQAWHVPNFTVFPLRYTYFTPAPSLWEMETALNLSLTQNLDLFLN